MRKFFSVISNCGLVAFLGLTLWGVVPVAHSSDAVASAMTQQSNKLQVHYSPPEIDSEEVARLKAEWMLHELTSEQDATSHWLEIKFDNAQWAVLQIFLGMILFWLATKISVCPRNEVFISALKAGNVERWNRWRLRNPNIGMVLDMKKVDLSHCNLTGANLSNLDLSNAKFEGTILNFANLNHSNLRGANFFNASIQDADLSFATLNSANFRNASLSGAKLYAVLAESANFTNATLSHASFRAAFLEFADFKQALMRETVLTNAVLDHASFQGAACLRMDLRGATLDGADFRGVATQTILTKTWDGAIREASSEELPSDLALVN